MLYYIFHVLPFQDGRIDYNEFVAMMQRGNADFSQNGLKGDTDFSIGFREALLVCWEKVETFFIPFPQDMVKLIAFEENSYQTFGFQLGDL